MWVVAVTNVFVRLRLLDEVDKDVTRVQDKLTNGMKRVAWVIKKNEGEDETLRVIRWHP